MSRPHKSRYPLHVEGALLGRVVRTRIRTKDGEPVRYQGRRLLPLPEAVAGPSAYTVRAGDRIDLVAARLLGDPTLYWLLMEANGASDPRELCAVPGRRIAVPSPVGRPARGFDHPRAASRTAVAAPAAHANDETEDL